jgi:hypothetical protein
MMDPGAMGGWEKRRIALLFVDVSILKSSAMTVAMRPHTLEE